MRRKGIRSLLPARLRSVIGVSAMRGRAILVAATNFGERRRLNVGGGPWFAHTGWRNLEDVPSLVNRSPFRLSPVTPWPFEDRSFDTIYTSHVLEHLDDDTVDALLTQSRRVLADSGRLVICIPDFDHAGRAWRAGDSSFFSDRYWKYCHVSHTWPARNVPDTLDSRAIFLHCGFWNSPYGHPFQRHFRRSHDAYHGPPAVPGDVIERLRQTDSPHAVSQFLRNWVAERETDFQFNHQNAWSRDELRAMLAAKGFRVVSTDSAAVIRACGDIPGIRARAEQSTFCLAEVQPIR